MTALADDSIDFQVNEFSRCGSSLPQIYSDLHRNIVSVVNENGVQITTPSYIAALDEPKVPQEQWDGVLAATVK